VEASGERKKLGFWMCLSLVVGCLIGSGIFLLPAELAPYGWNALIGWIITIVGATCLAYLFGQLARALPLAGGPYAYVEHAFGQLPAFAVTWSYWISLWSGNAAIAIAVVSYMSLFAPGLSSVPGAAAIAAIALIWGLTALNCISVRAGGSFQLMTAILKLVPLVVVIAIAARILLRGEPTATPPFASADINLSSVNAAAALTLWAMLGFEAASVASREVNDPARNIPRATVLGTLLVGAIYLLTATPITMFLPLSEVQASNAPFSAFVSHYWSPSFGSLIGLFAAISAMGALNGLVLIQGELPVAMARDGTFPRWFAKTSARGVAVRAQLLSTTLATILIAANFSRSMAGLFAFMALLSTATTLILYFACALSAWRLQHIGQLKGPLLVTPIAIVGSVFAIWTFYGAGIEPTLWSAALVAAGVPVYVLMRRAAGLNSSASTLAPEGAPAAPRE